MKSEETTMKEAKKRINKIIMRPDPWINIPRWRYKIRKENGFFEKVFYK